MQFGRPVLVFEDPASFVVLAILMKREEGAELPAFSCSRNRCREVRVRDQRTKVDWAIEIKPVLRRLRDSRLEQALCGFFTRAPHCLSPVSRPWKSHFVRR
jgi:hypothetical protein